MNKRHIEADTCAGCGDVVRSTDVDLLKRKKKLCKSCCSFRKVFREIEFMSVARWKDDLAEARSYRNKSTVMLFKRAVALHRVMNSEEFRADCRERGETPEEVLDAECDDVACNGVACKFRVLMKVLKMFPTEHVWRTRSFSEMVLEVINQNKNHEESAKPRTDWRGMYSELKHQYEELQSRFAEQQREIEALKNVGQYLETASF